MGLSFSDHLYCAWQFVMGGILVGWPVLVCLTLVVVLAWWRVRD